LGETHFGEADAAWLLEQSDKSNDPTQQTWGLVVGSTARHPAHFGHILAQIGDVFALFATLAARRDVRRDSLQCYKSRVREKKAARFAADLGRVRRELAR